MTLLARLLRGSEYETQPLPQAIHANAARRHQSQAAHQAAARRQPGPGMDETVAREAADEVPAGVVFAGGAGSSQYRQRTFSELFGAVSGEEVILQLIS